MPKGDNSKPGKTTKGWGGKPARRAKEREKDGPLSSTRKRKKNADWLRGREKHDGITGFEG